MDRAGVARAVLSLAGPGVQSEPDTAVAVRMAALANDHLAGEDALVARLEPFAAVVLMRERTPFPRALIERLPNLKLITTSGMWNARASPPRSSRATIGRF